MENGLSAGHLVRLGYAQRNASFNWGIKGRNDLPPLITGKNQHSIDLEQANAMDEADEHGHAGEQQRGDDPQATELNSTRTAPVYPSESRQRVKEGRSKYPEGVRNDGIAGNPQNQSRRVGSGAKLNHHE